MHGWLSKFNERYDDALNEITFITNLIECIWLMSGPVFWCEVSNL